MILRRLAWLSLAALTLAAQAAPPGWVSVREVPQTPRLSGFAATRPGTSVNLTAVQTGTIVTLAAAPGMTVRAGQVVAQLGGAELAATLTQAQGNDAAAAAVLGAERAKLADHLSTAALVAQAQANFDAAHVALAAARQALQVRSPVDGQVQSVSAAPGDFVRAGQAIAVVQPAYGTWVKAILYGGGDALLPGQAAQFIPADGAQAVPVTLRGPLGTQGDGGLILAFSGAGLTAGVAGTLNVTLSPRPALLVPNEALVLDNGQWWVMVHDAEGDHATRVRPGATEGGETVILSGLTAGQQVDVADAALLYHRGIAALYQPPD